MNKAKLFSLYLHGEVFIINIIRNILKQHSERLLHAANSLLSSLLLSTPSPTPLLKQHILFDYKSSPKCLSQFRFFPHIVQPYLMARCVGFVKTDQYLRFDKDCY